MSCLVTVVALCSLSTILLYNKVAVAAAMYFTEKTLLPPMCCFTVTVSHHCHQCAVNVTSLNSHNQPCLTLPITTTVAAATADATAKACHTNKKRFCTITRPSDERQIKTLG